MAYDQSKYLLLSLHMSYLPCICSGPLHTKTQADRVASIKRERGQWILKFYLEVANVTFTHILLAKVSHITKLDVNGTSIIGKLSGREEVIKRIPMRVTENIFK